MTQDKGKNIFQSAINAVSNRDEKAALEEAAKKMEQLEARNTELELKLQTTTRSLTEAQAKLTQMTNAQSQGQSSMTTLQAELAKAKADLAKAQSDLTAKQINLNNVQGQLSDTQRRFEAASAELQKYVSADQAKKTIEEAMAAEKARTMADHVVAPNETLSHLAQRYYGNAGEAYWRLIYEANKEAIGPNPGMVRQGTTLRIPTLPEELKKK